MTAESADSRFTSCRSCCRTLSRARPARSAWPSASIDLYGNETSIDALGQALRAGRARLNVRQQDLQLVNLESADSAVIVTLRAVRVGTYQFVIGSGITANVRVDAIPKP